MRRSDLGLQAFGQVAGALAGVLAGVFGGACNQQTRANDRFAANLQGLQALCASARMCVRACERRRAGAPAQGRALTRARVLPLATRKKSSGGNHLEYLQGGLAACKRACSPCNACNLGNGAQR